LGHTLFQFARGFDAGLQLERETTVRLFGGQVRDQREGKFLTFSYLSQITRLQKLNELTLWDKYYFRFENSVINEENSTPLFYFADDGTNLLGKDVTFVLRWTVIPNAGYMRNVDGGGEIVVKMPKNYNW
jgi:hypothetical protein